MGFPDYTTAQVMPGPGLCVAGRLRFGSKDLGVNAARIGGWMQELLGLEERPEMTGFSPASGGFQNGAACAAGLLSRAFV